MSTVTSDSNTSHRPSSSSQRASQFPFLVLPLVVSVLSPTRLKESRSFLFSKRSKKPRSFPSFVLLLVYVPSPTRLKGDSLPFLPVVAQMSVVFLSRLVAPNEFRFFAFPRHITLEFSWSSPPLLPTRRSLVLSLPSSYRLRILVSVPVLAAQGASFFPLTRLIAQMILVSVPIPATKGASFFPSPRLIAQGILVSVPVMAAQGAS